jgi:hypothetical protein
MVLSCKDIKIKAGASTNLVCITASNKLAGRYLFIKQMNLAYVS